MNKQESVVRETPLPRSLSRLLLGLRGVPQQEAEVSAGSAAISVRSLSSEELAETGEGSKLDLVAKLCTRGMFGEANAGGSSWVLRNFKTKYGEEAAAGRQSIMLVAETSDGDIVGCVGMELMLLTEDGRAWWANPCAIIKKRPFVSDLVVDATYRQRGLGRSLLLKCHDIVTSQWAEEIRAMTPAERLDLDVDRIFLKVDAENRAAVRLYRVMTCLAVSHALLAQYLACLCQMLSLPPCSTHLLATTPGKRASVRATMFRYRAGLPPVSLLGRVAHTPAADIPLPRHRMPSLSWSWDPATGIQGGGNHA